MDKRRQSKAGLTLVELMVAATVFAMVSAGAFAGLYQGFNFIDGSRHYTRISPILQSEVEYLRSLAWTELTALPATATITPTAQFSSDFYDPYTIERTITSVSSSVRQVTIEVTFEGTGKSGQTVSRSYVTFFTEGGVNDYYYRQL